MQSLPDTTPDHYLTGTSVFNIPDESGMAADWHFVDTFLSGKARFRVAGRNFPSTNEFLGDEDIHECSDTLRAFGVKIPEGVKFYAAGYRRAIMDLLFKNLQEGNRLDHLELADIYDYPAQIAETKARLEEFKADLPEENQLILEQWLNHQ